MYCEYLLYNPNLLNFICSSFVIKFVVRFLLKKFLIYFQRINCRALSFTIEGYDWRIRKIGFFNRILYFWKTFETYNIKTYIYIFFIIVPVPSLLETFTCEKIQIRTIYLFLIFVIWCYLNLILWKLIFTGNFYLYHNLYHNFNSYYNSVILADLITIL